MMRVIAAVQNSRSALMPRNGDVLLSEYPGESAEASITAPRSHIGFRQLLGRRGGNVRGVLRRPGAVESGIGRET